MGSSRIAEGRTSGRFPALTALLSVLCLALVACGADGVDESAAEDDSPVGVVNGTPVANGTYPFYAGLVPSFSIVNGKLVEGHPSCGGALISAQWVLSAAHCVNYGVMPLKKSVVIGFTSIDAPYDVRDVDYMAVPADQMQDGRDLALLHLSSPSSATPVLVTVDRAPVGVEGVVMGFGVTEQGRQSEVLMQAPMKAADPGICRQAFDAAGEGFDNNDVCVVGVDTPRGRTGIGKGDSGGPFLTKSADGSWSLAGVAHAVPNGISGNVASYVDIGVPVNSEWIGNVSATRFVDKWYVPPTDQRS